MGFVGSNPTPRIQVEIRRDGGGNSALPSDYGETGAASTLLAFGKKTTIDIEGWHEKLLRRTKSQTTVHAAYDGPRLRRGSQAVLALLATNGRLHLESGLHHKHISKPCISASTLLLSIHEGITSLLE